MKLATAFAAATILAGSMASAQLAFITQIGDDNTAINISERTGGNSSDEAVLNAEVQVIAQRGQNISAANVSRGSDNRAYTFQSNNTSNNPQFSGTLTSLILQGGPDDGIGNNNTAVTVQNNPGGGGTIISQTVQFGNNNVAINWTDNRGTALAGAPTPAFDMPTLAVNGALVSTPVGVTGTTASFGSATVTGTNALFNAPD